MPRVRPNARAPLFAALAFALCAAAGARAQSGGEPRLDSLRLVAELPEGLPKRISSIAYDGEKIWVMLYHGDGRHARLDPETLDWEPSREQGRHDAVADVAGAFKSPGGACFEGGRLWVGGSYGESFGYVDTRDWKVGRVFRVRQAGGKASQSYAGLACDGAHVWVAWHWFRYDLPASQTQALLKLDPETGGVVARYPLPAGTPNDGVHGLTWDGSRLWHAKDNRLSAIDPATGSVTSDYFLPAVRRATGLAWDGRSLWISEFDGKIWRLFF
ncbi:MAG TPA: hypothetical protein VF668_09395 [Pyrinomonadaceae bacterium]|jgi:hypothetical protein